MVAGNIRGTVDTKHPLYDRYKETYDMVEACVEGEQAVKKGKHRWLPVPNPYEWNSRQVAVHDAAKRRYDSYLARARFLNATGRTLNGMLGIVFAEPVNIDLSGALTVLATDADGKGQPLTQFLRDTTAEVLKSGRGYILSDYTGNGEATEETRGDPVLRLFYGSQIINWRTTAGKDTLIVLEYQEDVEDDTGFINQLRTVWLELRMVNGQACVRKWTQETGGRLAVAGTTTKTDLVVLRDANGNPLDEFPGAWIGSVNNDAFPDPAPLSDIAAMNIGHFQADADVVEAARIVGQPTLVVAGLTEAWADKYLKSGITVGATTGILLNETASAQILQANETSASTVLKDTRAKEMAMLGAKLLERGTAAKTATQADYEAQTDNSILSLCAGNVERAVNKALQMLARMVGGNGSVQINQRYDMSAIDGNLLTALLAQVQGGTLSLHDYIRYQQKIGLVSPDQTPEQIEDNLRSQAPLPGMTGLSAEDTNTEDTTNNSGGTVE